MPRPPLQRSLILGLALGTPLLVAPPAGAFYEIARGEVLLNTTARGAYDSNIFGNANETPDFVLDLIPELQFLRAAGQSRIDLRGGIDIQRFLDNPSQNSEDPYTTFLLTLPVSPESRLSGNVRGSYRQDNSVNLLLNQRVFSETVNGGANGAYRLSDRIAARAAFDYINSRTRSFSTVETIGGGGGAEYRYSENLSFFTDYRLRNSRSYNLPVGAVGIENWDHAVLVGASGELLPRVQGTVSGGYQHTTVSGVTTNDSNRFIADALLLWNVQEQTDVTFTANRDVYIAPDNANVEMSTFTAGVTHRFTEKISGTGTVGYGLYDYEAGNRSDSNYRFGAGVSYLFTRYWSASLAYDYIYNHSDLSAGRYDRQIVTVQTRYTF